MAKECFVVVDGEKVPVSEEIYRVFKRPLWSERKRREVRVEHERSLEAFMESGFDIPDSGKLADEIAEDKLMLEMLLAALDELTADERNLINALFYNEKSEREYAAESGIPHPTIHSRKNAVLKKLKKLLGGF
ncbi:RNA polymerase subunit sigma-24 [Clostridia bacterium]|nr:RNA polymerase subunit sigma-24 [Clostridia bacterium]